MRILVGGASGDIGVGCARVLKEIEAVHEIVGFDIRPEPWNEFYLDGFYLSPRADAPNFLCWLQQQMGQAEEILYLPTSEAELSRLSGKDVPQELRGRVLMNRPDIINSCLDKAVCNAALSSVGLSVPSTGIVGLSDPTFFPVILKPRSGRGSSNIRFAKDTFEYSTLRAEGDIWQEHISQNEGEYTCGVFRARNCETRCIVLQRELRNGRTVSGMVVESEKITHYLMRIADLYDLTGSFNVQLRLRDGVPLAFEINPRLSSTVVFRHQLGFKDLQWWLQSAFGKPIDKYIPPATGTRFFRTDAEIIQPPLESRT